MFTSIKKIIVRTSLLINVLLVVGGIIFAYAGNVKISGHITGGNDAFAKSITQEDTRVDEANVMADPTITNAQQPHVPARKPKPPVSVAK